MKLEEQVVSLDLAKKLKEAGVRQESVFFWENQVSRDAFPSYRIVQYPAEYAAFTVAELGSLLPHGTISYFSPYREWHCKTPGNKKTVDMEMTEANARASILLYLIKNGLWHPVAQ